MSNFWTCCLWAGQYLMMISKPVLIIKLGLAIARSRRQGESDTLCPTSMVLDTNRLFATAVFSLSMLRNQTLPELL